MVRIEERARRPWDWLGGRQVRDAKDHDSQFGATRNVRSFAGSLPRAFGQAEFGQHRISTVFMNHVFMNNRGFGKDAVTSGDRTSPLALPAFRPGAEQVLKD